MRFAKFAVLCFVLNFSSSFFAEEKEKIVWRFDFSAPDAQLRYQNEWKQQNKFLTRPASFEFKNEGRQTFLRMRADRATASILCNPKFKPSDAPVVRWCWRVIKLPDNADGRDPKRDDQAIGLYIGSGTMRSKSSVSYRWDTKTPKGAEGNCVYGVGTIKIKWFTLRNEEDKIGEWVIEERNWLDDYKTAWNEVPDNIYLSISCNSQYTGTVAIADLLWVEFLKK